jgi:hypothetical protein
MNSNFINMSNQISRLLTTIHEKTRDLFLDNDGQIRQKLLKAIL